MGVASLPRPGGRDKGIASGPPSPLIEVVRQAQRIKRALFAGGQVIHEVPASGRARRSAG